MKMDKHINCCFFSSFIFITNVLTGIYYEQSLYTLFHFFLLSTCISYHAKYTRITYFLDQMGCVSASFHGFYLAVSAFLVSLSSWYGVLLSFLYYQCALYVVVSYYWGKRVRKFSHHPDPRIGNYYHSLLHVVSSVGNHCALLLSVM